MMGAFSLSMLREHRSTYVGVAAVIFLASLIMGMSWSGLVGVQSLDGLGPEWMGQTQAQQQEAESQLDGSVSFLSTTVFLTAFVMLFMVASSMAFAVAERRDELALLRLTGATIGQSRRMMLVESLIISSVAAATGTTAGALVATPALALVSTMGLAPSGVLVEFRPGILLLSFSIAVLASLAGAWSAARGISRIAPIEALGVTGKASRTMSPIRWIIGAIASAGVLIILLLPVDVGEFQTMTLLVSFTGIIALTAFAPVLVPLFSAALGTAGRAMSPSSGLLAQTHARWASRRTAALAVPILVLMGISAPMFMIAQTSLAMNQERYANALEADLVVERTRALFGKADLERIATAPGVAVAGQLETSAGWSSADAASDDTWVSWIDPSIIDQLAHVEVLAGSLSSIRDDTVATTLDDVRVGDQLALVDPEGAEHTVTIGAVIESTSILQSEFLADTGFAEQLQDDAHIVQQQVWATLDPAAHPADTIDAIEQDVPGSRALTLEEWMREGAATWQDQQVKGILTMLAAGVLLAAFSMMQTTLSSLRERKQEFRLLTQIGTNKTQVFTAVLGELVIILSIAGLLVAALLTITYTRLSQMLAHMGSTILPVIPLPLLIGLFLGCAAVTAVAAVIGTSWALNHSNARRRRA